MAIVILSPGILTSVQDGGRYGYQQYGVSPSGPMDARSMRTANILVGNDEDAAALEMTLMGAEIRFTAPHVISLTGADMGASLNGAKAPMYRALRVNSGDILKLGFAARGCRSYLAVRGGIDVKPVMGSRATMLGKQFGGYQGRKLQKDDILEICPAGGDLPHPETWFTNEDPMPSGTVTLRVIMGPQKEYFTEKGIRTFLDSEYCVGQEFDRQGYRLKGEKIEHVTDSNIISDGVVTGSIQVPGTGLPIIMTAERATVGGYTKIATVITADLPLIGQCKSGDRIRFREVTVEQAQQLLREESERLETLKKQMMGPSHLAAAGSGESSPAAAPAAGSGKPCPAVPAAGEPVRRYKKEMYMTVRVNGTAYEVKVQEWE